MGIWTKLRTDEEVNSTWAILSALSLQNWVGWLKCCTRWGSRHNTLRGKPVQRDKDKLSRPSAVERTLLTSVSSRTDKMITGWKHLPIDWELSTTGTRETGVSWQKSCKVRSEVAWEVKPFNKRCWIPEKPLQLSWACSFSRRSRFSALSKGTWEKKKCIYSIERCLYFCMMLIHGINL